MEDYPVYHVLPDSPVSVLDMFSTSKEGITLFASKVINEVENGNLDPLKVKIYIKTLESIAEKIEAGTKEAQKTAASKYGERPFMFSGAELHLTATKTEYDYAACGDPVINEMIKDSESLTKRIKQRQEFLKSMGGTEQIVVGDELVSIHPPIKKSSMGVKCSIK